MSNEIESVDWAPAHQKEAGDCFDVYNEYVNERKTVTELAISTLKTAAYVKKQIKWACIALKNEKGDSEMVKQMADTAVSRHIDKYDELIAEIKGVRDENKKRALLNAEHLEDDNWTELPLLKETSLRDYTSLLRERRLAIMDLQRVRGVLDFTYGGGGGGAINIIMPGGLNRGLGVQTLKDKPVVEVKPDA